MHFKSHNLGLKVWANIMYLFPEILSSHTADFRPLEVVEDQAAHTPHVGFSRFSGRETGFEYSQFDSSAYVFSEMLNCLCRWTKQVKKHLKRSSILCIYKHVCHNKQRSRTLKCHWSFSLSSIIKCCFTCIWLFCNLKKCSATHTHFYKQEKM